MFGFNRDAIPQPTKDQAVRPPAMTTRERQQQAARPKSFTDQLPWMEYDAATKTFVLEDGRSRGILFELIATPTEARNDAFLENRRHEIQAAISSLPEADDAEWIVQIFVNDDANIESLGEQQFKDYILDANKTNPERAQAILNSPYTKAYMAEMLAHLKAVSNPNGFFDDEEVSGNAWRGLLRRVRCVLYRRYPPNYDFSQNILDPVEQLTQAGEGFTAALREAGVQSRVGSGRDFYEWMLPFFNPKPDFADSIADLLRKCPYPGDDDQGVFGRDFADQLLLSMPNIDCKEGVLEFDGLPTRALTLQSLTRAPQIGHFTAERRHDDKLYARFDRMPPGTMLSVTVVIRAQDRVKNFVQAIANASRATTAEARYTADETSRCLHRIAQNDKLFPTFVTLYIRGENRPDLRRKTAAVNAQLQASGFKFIEPRHDLIGVDAFMRGLPMNFDSRFDALDMKRSRFVFASHIASFLPLYGRARGTGNPGFWFWNRGGEPLLFDPLNRHDRKKNAHLLMLGPTGAGKSATGCNLAMQVAAIYRPRFVIVELGGSFDLLGDYFKENGLSVHRLTLSVGANVSLPPFASAHSLLDDVIVVSALSSTEKIFDGTKVLINDPVEEVIDAPRDHLQDVPDDDVDDKRDILGEMVITARLMITGGEEAESAKMSRADRYLIARAILDAAKLSKAAGKAHPLSEDVAHALMSMKDDPTLGPDRKVRAEEMGQAMLVFCDQGLRGRLFNREGQAWPDADVTIVNLGTLGQEGYDDALAVAYIGLMNHTQALAERTQYDSRPNIFITDEGHIVTTNPLLLPYAVKITKMWRKLGTWFWLFTQDMKDFPDSASRILNMCEWWLLLTMAKDEISHVARFRELTAEQRGLMESAKKSPPRYTEGVVLSSSMQALFRNVPPALPIALAMTEKHEKAERRQIMRELNVTELGAAKVVASRLTLRRG
ncbi:MAG: conjugative transfer ATPase [Herminiimonas sp.]|nr:conjugative transfer ATPase [Herminiimonas sp.]